MTDYLSGQRWMSEAQPDLGLGTVLESDAQTVTLLYPAGGETRTYAKRSAPLARVRFGPGDTVEDHEGAALIVRETREQDGLLVYLGVRADGAPASLPEARLNDRLTLNRPQDRLLRGHLDADHWFRLRREAWKAQAEHRRSPVYGMTGARMGLIPHQLYIAHEIGVRQAPRVLLADEVGLGKTIEAGLILHRQLLTGRARRILIIVPDSLINQWLVEMLRRFHLRFALFDQERFEQEQTENPFEAEQRILCSLELLTGHPEIARAALQSEWDLLVVDEAHHLHWTETESSLEYDLIEALVGQTQGVLLLTATPEQLGRAGHFGRLRLLDPDRFHDYRAFVEEETRFAPIAALAARLDAGQALDAQQQALLRSLNGDTDLTPEQHLRRLIDQHGTGRVLFRNTRAAIRGFPQRRPQPHPLPPPEAHAAETYNQNDLDQDPRVAWLVETLDRIAPEKMLVICARAATAITLRDHLFRRYGKHAGVFHEGMEIIERDRAAAYFADPEEGAQALICSEIGSEGRNFQFAHHLTLFDLPLEPGLVEQRIGRLDRIGQRETIRIHIPYFAHGGAQPHPDEILFRWYHEGLNAFTRPCPAGETVYERLGPDLLRLLESGGAPEAVDALITQARALTQELNQAMEAGRDRLLELNSHRPEVSADLVERLQRLDQDPRLADYMTRYWDAFGVEHEPGPGRSIVLRPGHHMLQPNFPELPEDGVTLNVHRDDALAHEDHGFLTWEHPMARGAVDLLHSGELGTAGMTVLRHPQLQANTLLLELIYLVECAAPAELEINRYLPPTPIRLLLDAQGRDHAAAIAPETLTGICLTRERKTAHALIRQQETRIRDILRRAEPMAQMARDAQVKTARAEMDAALEEELRRLQALAQVNPNVRRDEIDYLRARRALAGEHMGQARLRLDAVRVVVAR